MTTSVSKAAAERRAAKAELASHQIWANAMEDQFQDKVTIVNMYKLLCGERPCPIFDDKGDLLYLDTSHLSMAGAQWAAQRIKQQHPQLFRKR